MSQAIAQVSHSLRCTLRKLTSHRQLRKRTIWSLRQTTLAANLLRARSARTHDGAPMRTTEVNSARSRSRLYKHQDKGRGNENEKQGHHDGKQCSAKRAPVGMVSHFLKLCGQSLVERIDTRVEASRRAD